jgi:hypothetical protein
MTTLWRRLGGTTALLLTLGVAGVASGQAAAANDAPNAPFNATVQGTANLTGGTAPFALFSGAGSATHMGKITNVGYASVTGQPQPASAYCPNAVTDINEETFIASNRDSVVIEAVDIACPTSPTSWAGSGTWTIVPGSGTGRFAGATGRGAAHGVGDFTAHTFRFDYTGTITLMS